MFISKARFWPLVDEGFEASDGKKSPQCTLFFSFLFLILCIQVWSDNPNNILKTQRIMASPSYSTERPTFGSWWIKALKPSDGKISTIIMFIILLTFYSRYFASKFGFMILTSCWKLSGLGQVHHVQLKFPFWLMVDQGFNLKPSDDKKKITIAIYALL